MEYGIVHTAAIVNGSLEKTAIGYVEGLANIVAYNAANSPTRVIEQYTTDVSNVQGLIKLN